MSEFEVRGSGPGGSQQIHFHCPGCSRKLRAPVSGAGKADVCPGCGHRFVVPKQDQANDAPERARTTETRAAEPRNDSPNAVVVSIERIERCRGRAYGIARVAIIAGVLLCIGAGVTNDPAPDASGLLLALGTIALTVGVWSAVVWIVFLIVACVVQYAEARRVAVEL